MIDELVKIIATSIRFISNGRPHNTTRGTYEGPAEITKGPKPVQMWRCKKPDIKIPMEDGFLDTNLNDITKEPWIRKHSDGWTVLYPYESHIAANLKHFKLNIYEKQGKPDMKKTILELQTKLAGYCGREHKDFFKAPNNDIIPNEVGIETMYSERENKWGGACDVCCADVEQFPDRFEPFLSLPGNNWVCKECIGVHRLRMVGLSERALRREQLLPTGLKF